MGNSHPIELTEEARVAVAKFSVDEIHVLRETYKDLAHRSLGDSIDKETFLQYIPLPGLFGERLFSVFDRHHTGKIHFEEFICGLAICCRGSWDEKIRFIFNMYDVSGQGFVSRVELATLLNHVPKSVFRLHQTTNGHADHEDRRGSEAGSEHDHGSNCSSCNERSEELSRATSAEEELDYFTNNDMVESAFAECDLNHEGKLSYEQFKMWVERTPQITEYLQSILPFGVKEKVSEEPRQRHDKRKSLPFRGRSSQNLAILSDSFQSFHGVHRESIASPTSMHDLNGTEHVNDEEGTRRLLQQVVEITKIPALKEGAQKLIGIIDAASNIALRPIVDKESHLWKRGKAFHMWHQRYYLLSGNCMYYYPHDKDARPRGVIFLAGSIIEALKHDEEHEVRGYWGFEIVNTSHAEQRRVLYTRSPEERDEWVTLLQHAAEVVPIEEEYVIGKELGRGRFSHVHECVHKLTGKHFAVKIIDKATIEPEEKELLRTEIAVLKLVDHPYIIQMQAVYESRQHLYIVMELLQGGELFERIVGRPRFSEDEAAKVIRPLIESVAYLHDLGIVHRDIKPENILCGEDLCDLKIADFGLSKLLLPRETMRMPCGTLSYVAPEVLTMSGYGKEADMWSVGVIMFLLHCGKLPFDGEQREEIISNTIRGELNIKNPVAWNALTDDCRDLILGLLNKDPSKRYSARQALRHPWINRYPYHPHHHHHHHHSTDRQSVDRHSSSRHHRHGSQDVEEHKHDHGHHHTRTHSRHSLSTDGHLRHSLSTDGQARTRTPSPPQLLSRSVDTQPQNKT